jgi:hypothetical protein
MLTDLSRQATQQMDVSYLLLSQFDGQFESIEMHSFAVLKRRPSGIMIQQYFQLIRTPRVIQQRSREVLALLPEFLHRCHHNTEI